VQGWFQFSLKKKRKTPHAPRIRHLYNRCRLHRIFLLSFLFLFLIRSYIISYRVLFPFFFLNFFLSVSLSLSNTPTAPNKTHHQLRSAPSPSMAKKRKSVATRLDEVDRTMYSTFCSTANSLSHLYTHAMNQQKLSFQAGERHALVRPLLSYSDLSCFFP